MDPLIRDCGKRSDFNGDFDNFSPFRLLPNEGERRMSKQKSRRPLASKPTGKSRRERVRPLDRRNKRLRAKERDHRPSQAARVKVVESKPLTRGVPLDEQPMSALYALREQIRDREDRARKALMQELADCLNIKIALAHNYQEYLEFTRDSFWEKNNKKKKKMRPSANREGPLLLFVLFFAYRARSKGTIIPHVQISAYSGVA